MHGESLRPTLRRLTLAAFVLLPSAPAVALPEWPPVRQETRPWTRLWWMGSDVDAAGLRASLESCQRVGLGGVEITPIYGVRGREARFVPYLSAAWVDRLDAALAEARRLDLGVDLATGTGWPFGGPWVNEADACRNLAHREYRLRDGERLAVPVVFEQQPLLRAVSGRLEIGRLIEPVEANPDLQALAIDQVRFPRRLPPQALMAFGDDGQVVDLTGQVDAAGRLDWTAPAGEWRLFAVFIGQHGKLVERAAPGGEGNVIDHFAEGSIRRYLARFDEALGTRALQGLRAFFNDSYEVDDAAGQADWTPALFEEFARRRGYDLRRELPALLSDENGERVERVRSDYRETLSDLLLERFTRGWSDWAHERGRLVRNQAHGSPASLLDLYAASDVPETEGEGLYRLKWATSAANVAGRRLVSAETATWLKEHFLSTLADVRGAVDRMFLAGVNHVVYHGTSYSPPGEAWPGWPFYAAVHFDPHNPWWEDLAALNAYVTRTQSFLQSSPADHDVLLHFPFHDALAAPGRGRLVHFGTEQRDLPGSAFDSAFDLLSRRGYTFDFVSDRLLRQVEPGGTGLVSGGGGAYRVLVLPSARYLPIESLEHALELARGGAVVIAYRGLPDDVPGLHDVPARRARLRARVAELAFAPADERGVRRAALGRGAVLAGDDLEALLAAGGVARESLVDRGLAFERRRRNGGRLYFVSNPNATGYDDWLPLATQARAVALFDPMSGARGWARLRPRGSGGSEVRVQLRPGGSIIMWTDPGGESTGEPWPYRTPSGPTQPIDGPWTLRFVRGGPALPHPAALPALGPWTRLDGEAVRAFSGTATYATSFPRPAGASGVWRLDLGEVRESARVRLNGRDLGVSLGSTHTYDIDTTLLQSRNALEVDVTNLMANRIADLERRGVPWKRFYNVNVAARLKENRDVAGLFTAAHWTPRESGLLGPVTLQPLRAIEAQ